MLRFSGLTETESTRAWTVAWESLKKEGMPESFLKSEEGMDVLLKRARKLAAEIKGPGRKATYLALEKALAKPVNPGVKGSPSLLDALLALAPQKGKGIALKVFPTDYEYFNRKGERKAYQVGQFTPIKASDGSTHEKSRTALRRDRVKETLKELGK